MGYGDNVGRPMVTRCRDVMTEQWAPVLHTSHAACTTSVHIRAANDPSASIGFIIMEKAPTRAFSWLKVPSSAFTFKTLLHNGRNQGFLSNGSRG